MKNFEKKLFSLQKFGVKLGLQNIEKFLIELNNPQEKLKFFHVAGSNGKGSVASYIASILMEDGYKVGLYTSPHLVSFNERVRINGIEITDEYIEKFLDRWMDYILANKLTFFEATTAMALCYFRDNNVDFVSWETGLGGRLDATNVVEPLVSTITTISLEHTDYLGNTIEQIAYEKAGIIKRNKITCVGLLPENAMAVIEKIALEKNNIFLKLKNFLHNEGGNYYLDYKSKKILLKPALIGSYQIINSALGVLSVLAAIEVKDSSIANGLNNVVKNSKIQGRFELINANPLVVFDAAHNSEGVDSFVRELSVLDRKFDKKILLFGVMKDKQVELMLTKLMTFFDEVGYVEIQEERCLKFEDSKIIAERLGIKKFYRVDKPEVFINDFIKSAANQNNLLAYCGSIYVMGYIKRKLNEIKK